MKITGKKDRVRLQAETRRESQVIVARLDLLFSRPAMTSRAVSIANDHGCRWSRAAGEYLNYYSLPLRSTLFRRA